MLRKITWIELLFETCSCSRALIGSLIALKNFEVLKFLSAYNRLAPFLYGSWEFDYPVRFPNLSRNSRLTRIHCHYVYDLWPVQPNLKLDNELEISFQPIRVFLSRDYRLIVAPRKFDVLKTSEAKLRGQIC